MSAKLAQLRKLQSEGYVVEDVHSDDVSVEVTLRRGDRRASIRFLPHEAKALLSLRVQ